jgi:hypothetical protein
MKNMKKCNNRRGEKEFDIEHNEKMKIMTLLLKKNDIVVELKGCY